MTSEFWIRPKNVPYPSVWLTFKAKDLNSDDLVEYRVQDLTEEYFGEAFINLKNFFMKDEAMNNSIKLWQDQESIEFLHDLWGDIVKQRLSLVCFRENSNELVGCNMLYLAYEAEKKPKVYV